MEPAVLLDHAIPDGSSVIAEPIVTEEHAILLEPAFPLDYVVPA